MTDQASTWQRSTTRRFLKWLFSWRTARRLLIGGACLVTVWALFCTEENIRGRRTWEKYRRELESRGVQLDFKAFVPKPVPDEQNFAATPVIQSWFAKGTFVDNDRRWQDAYERAEKRMRIDRDHRQLTDLVAWAGAFGDTNSNQRVDRGQLDMESRAKAAPSVLEGLKTNEAVFAELRAASHRPYSRYPVNFDVEEPFSILLPHLSNVRAVCRRLNLKACGELAAGRSAEALEDVNLIFRLTESLNAEPFLVTYLVRIACLQNALQPVWEGLAEHRWSDAQLQELESRLQQYNFVADVKPGFASERAACMQTTDNIRRHGLGYLVDVAGPGSPSPSDRSLANLVSVFIPLNGWMYLEQYNLYHASLALVDGTMDSTQRRVSPSRSAANVREFEQHLRGEGLSAFVHHRVLVALLLPALNNIITKTAVAQTVADEATLACALERYRLANGQFPEKLDALVPSFISPLPHDVITGEPYKYRRTDDGQFVLYSVGWNETDDGGVPGKKDFDDKQGDWVWQYPSPK